MNMRVALLQFDIAWENKKKNFKKVEELISQIKGKDVDFVVLPELFSIGYTMNPKPFAETLSGETPGFLSELAKRYQVYVLGSFAESTDTKPKNSAILFNKEGKMILHYSKMHLFSAIGENKNYAPGEETSLVEVDGQKIGVVICYDLRFPEIFRKMSSQGATCIFVIANWPRVRIKYWDLLLKARAAENQLFIVGENIIGRSPDTDYCGHSMVIEPAGDVIASAKENAEEVLIADLDFSLVDKTRNQLPLLKDRKPLGFWK
ncbi:carbon-nitrogen family hydrolase [Candidatus Woesearchaeota archaeon]|nr:carbon-nitrogen family hydrolase [Candidatus Woesearchaeota archaeon]